jgi:O-antigen/teichoic acid export membrane protein
LNLFRTVYKNLKGSLSKGALHLLFAMGFSQALLFLLSIALARFLGPGEYGHIRVISAVLKLAVIPAALGMPAAISKYVAELPDERGGKSIFSQGMSFSLLTSVIVSLVIFVVLKYADPIGDELARRYLLLLCWSIPLSIFSTGAIAFFQGRKQIRRMAAYQAMLAAIRVAFIGVLTFFFFFPGYAGGLLAAEFIGALILFRVTRPVFRFHWDRAVLLKMVRLGAFASLGLTFATLTLTMDTLCLSAILADPFLVGQYGVAITLAIGLMLIPEAISQTFFPYLSAECRNPLLLKVYFRQLFRMIGVLMLVVCSVVFVFAPSLIIAIFGPEYGPASGVLRVLLPGIFCYSLQKIPGIFLFARGRTDLNFYIILIGGTLNIILNIVFIRQYGLIGAAYATSITFALRLVISLFFYFQQLRHPAR